MRRRMSALMICLLMAFMGLRLCRAATNAREVEESCSLRTDLVTPHKPWGRGYVGGPVRTLFFIYTGTYDGNWEDPRTAVREVVEFGQRFDLRSDAVLVCGKGEGQWGFHGVKLGEQRAERLLEKPYQLYVIAGFPMEKLPARMQYLILKEVAAGAGLLCAGPGAREYMVPRRRVEPTPEFLTAGIPQLDEAPIAEVVSAYNLGEGRGVRLNYGTRSLVAAKSFSPREMNVYDYRMLLAGRAALWAAGRDNAVNFGGIFDDESLVINQADDGVAGEMSLHSAAAKPIEVTVSLERRRVADGIKTSLGEQTLTLRPGQTARMQVPLPRCRAGDYFVDAIVSSRRGVEAFGAGALTVESDFGVEEVELDASFVEVGGTIGGVVRLRGEIPAGASLRMRLRDSYGRIVRQEDFAAAAEIPFEYEADSFWTNLMRVEAVVVGGGAEIDMKDASFSVPKRRHDEFTFVMWDAPLGALGPYAWRQMQEAGYNICLMGSMGKTPRSTPGLAACDASLVPYSTRILDPKDEEGFMQPVCWNDEPAVSEYVQGIVDNQQLMREQGVFVYSLGDEGVTKGCCVHPACLDAYRRYLAQQYETIERLNGSWGAEYASFDEVDLLDRGDNMEAASRKTNFPRWYDRQAFARRNLVQFSGRFGEAYSRLDPLSKTGFEGTGRFGDDYDAILATNDFYGPYPSIGDDIVRSAARPETVSSNWMGYSKTGDALSDAAWRMVMKGKNSIWYWMWSGIGSYIGYLRPTFDEWPVIEDLTEEMQPVREGLGDLLMNSSVVHSGIGVFYSVPSALAGDLGGGFIKPVNSHEIWTQLTYELGLDFRYVTSGMLRDGVLGGDEFRVLLLPMSQALDREEAALIRGFAERGGTVIADVRPGIYDGHCKPITPGLLDEMFGITRTAREDAVEATVSIGGSLDGRDLDLKLDKVKLDAGVEATTAEVLGGGEDGPALLVNDVGEGRAILLNFQLASSSDSEPQTPVAREFLALLYDVSGARSALAFASPDGGPLPATETRIWENGAALVFGMWRQMPNAWFNPKGDTIAGKPAPARVTLPRPAHVYDLRAGRYLGSVERLDTRLAWGRASFFLALPYKIQGLTVAATPTRLAADEVVTASISLALPDRAEERFAIWTEVVSPSGDRPLWGRRVVVLVEGAGQVQVRVAHNDTPGRWRLVATELFSGQSAEASWTVR